MKINARDICLMGLFTALITAGAFIRIPVPVIPFTLQFLFTTLAGLLLGSRLGGKSVATYIFLGLVGLPIFASGGGISYIFKPSFGYLIGFCAGAFVTGKIRESHGTPTFNRLLIANFVGLFVVYFLGMIYYFVISNFYLHSPIGLWPLFLYCFVLAVPGDIVLCFVAAALAKRLLPVLRKGNAYECNK